MISRNLSRRLDRLEARLVPTSGPRFMEITVIAVETEEVIQRILMPWDDPHDRGRRPHPWERKTHERDHQTTAPA